MRYRHFLPIFLFALALGAPAVMADPSPGATAYDQRDDKAKKDKDRGYRSSDDGRDRRGPRGVPPGHMPPPGECRVWYNDRPPGHQPPPTDCATARREANRTGGHVVYGSRDDRRDDRWDDHDRWDDDDWWDDDDVWTDRFGRLDRNRDGYISGREWTGDDRTFDLLDRNNDRRLTPAELRYRDGWEGRFGDLDRNRDGLLNGREWTGRRADFDRLDRNDDGNISLREWLQYF